MQGRKAEQRAKAGLCEKCGERPLASMHFCKECLAERRERAKQLRAKKGA